MARRSPLGRVLHYMAPHRVAWRALFHGEAFPTRRHVKAKYGPRTVATGSKEDYERMLAAGKRGAKKTAAKKAATGKPGGKGRSDVYASARQIPGRNQAVAKKATAAANRAGKKTAAGTVQVPKRNPDGTFDGSVSFPTFGPREQSAYERALRGQVDPVQQVRRPRRRK